MASLTPGQLRCAQDAEGRLPLWTGSSSPGQGRACHREGGCSPGPSCLPAQTCSPEEVAAPGL